MSRPVPASEVFAALPWLLTDPYIPEVHDTPEDDAADAAEEARLIAQHHDLDADGMEAFFSSYAPTHPEWCGSVHRLPDGTRIDLSRELCDVLGTTWQWTGSRDSDGSPLMTVDLLGDSSERAVSLPDLWQRRGPLLELPPAPAPQVTVQPKPAPSLPHRVRHAIPGGRLP